MKPDGNVVKVTEQSDAQLFFGLKVIPLPFALANLTHDHFCLGWLQQFRMSSGSQPGDSLTRFQGVVTRFTMKVLYQPAVWVRVHLFHQQWIV